MTGEARRPPLQLGAKLRRALGGQAGWSGFALQVVLVVVLAWVAHEIIDNARENLATQKIASGFGFLWSTAGFGVSQTLIPYTESDTYLRVMLVGLTNTLAVSIVGIFFATIIGFVVGLGRLSPNWLLARIAGAYVELIRNLPLLFQILFWYLAVLAALPQPRQSINLFDSVFLSNRGFGMPKPIGTEALLPFLIAIALAVVLSIVLRSVARRRLFATGQQLTIWPIVIAALIGLPVVAVFIFGAPWTWEYPVLRGFNFNGGMRVVPEFAALAIALSTYSGAFIAEIVRAGVQSVQKGQAEAGASLGLKRSEVMRLIVVPQAMRVILPPLTNQYLNLTKNSSLAVAIGYPDLVSVFAGTALSQTGQAIEIVAITMAIYLVISLITSALMTAYGWRTSRSMGA
ncbi:amino acid ABC transporter permease [Tardiphaga sp.]|jgi:general L-amino acid transport system permease protein|uniref:amino acid ABC transporter permease n=1 Tax=Tardiphaga sp. TaxID=1926292 RepID=UPI0037DA55D2